MPYQLDFQKRQRYESLKSGISVDATLRRAGLETTCLAKIDTGSAVCLFERGAGEFLEIEIESGTAKTLSTLTGRLLAYGHEIVLETLGLEFQTVVYFSGLMKCAAIFWADRAGYNWSNWAFFRFLVSQVCASGSQTDCL